MKDISWYRLFWIYIIAVFTIEVILALFFSMTDVIIEIFPYLCILPLILLARTYPRKAFYFTIVVGWIYLGLMYFYMPFEIRSIAASIAWFYVFVTIGVVISSLTESGRQEKKFREIFDNSLAGIFTLECNSRRFTELNAHTAAVLGYEPPELEGVEISRIWGDVRDPDLFFKIQPASAEKEPVEVVLKRKDGSAVLVLLTVSPAGTNRLVCSIIDISEKKEIRDNLIESELRYHLLFDRAADAIFIHDPEGSILIANDTAAILSGYPVKKLQELRMQDMGIVPEDGFASGRNTGVLSKGQILFESLLMTRSGVPLPVEVSSKVIEYETRPAILSTIRDITERRHAEIALRESETRYMMIGDLIPFGVWSCDAKGNYTYLSGSFLSLLGTTLDEIRKNGWLHLLPREDYDRTAADWKQCVQTGSFWDYEYRIMDRNKRLFIVLSRGAPHTDSTGRITSWVGLHIDITERKRYEERLESSLREKEVIIKEVHHRVKNNMQVISGFLDLQSNYISDPVAIEKLGESQRRVRTMALVHEKLYQAKNLGVINAADYIKSLISDLMNASSLATTVEISVDVDDVTMNLDMAIPCGLIINELVTNTLKHAFDNRPEGKLSVALHHRPDHTFSLVVEDNGAGLPADFETRSRSSLGMQLVGVLVHQLGGNLQAGGTTGARFEIVFPEKF